MSKIPPFFLPFLGYCLQEGRTWVRIPLQTKCYFFWYFFTKSKECAFRHFIKKRGRECREKWGRLTKIPLRIHPMKGLGFFFWFLENDIKESTVWELSQWLIQHYGTLDWSKNTQNLKSHALPAQGLIPFL